MLLFCVKLPLLALLNQCTLSANRFDTLNPRYFDLQGHHQRVLHPHIQIIYAVVHVGVELLWSVSL